MYQQINSTAILRISDNAFIPADPVDKLRAFLAANPDVAEILK